MIELTKDNLRIDSEMEVDSENGREIIVYIEPWIAKLLRILDKLGGGSTKTK